MHRLISHIYLTLEAELLSYSAEDQRSIYLSRSPRFNRGDKSQESESKKLKTTDLSAR